MSESLPVSAAAYDLVPPDNQLTSDEAAYVAAARADNTIRGYRSDWREWCAWSASNGFATVPATPPGISRYITELARHGAAVGTMARRLSSIRFAHRIRNLPDPTADARVMTVWQGIRRTHGAPPEQAAPLMPPELFDVVDACPTTKTWKTRGRPHEPSLAGARDRALLLVGFTAALRRSELAALRVEDLGRHPNGLVVSIPRSKSNQSGMQRELAVLPQGTRPARCPVTAVTTWLEAAGITEGPVLRRVTKANKPGPQSLNPETINQLVQDAIARAGIDAVPYSAHSLRAGFVTYAHLRGASDRAIAHQTRHRSLATLGQYVRVHEAWEDNAATQLGL